MSLRRCFLWEMKRWQTSLHVVVGVDGVSVRVTFTGIGTPWVMSCFSQTNVSQVRIRVVLVVSSLLWNLHETGVSFPLSFSTSSFGFETKSSPEKEEDDGRRTRKVWGLVSKEAAAVTIITAIKVKKCISPVITLVLLSLVTPLSWIDNELNCSSNSQDVIQQQTSGVFQSEVFFNVCETHYLTLWRSVFKCTLLRSGLQEAKSSLVLHTKNRINSKWINCKSKMMKMKKRKWMQNQCLQIQGRVSLFARGIHSFYAWLARVSTARHDLRQRQSIKTDCNAFQMHFLARETQTGDTRRPILQNRNNCIFNVMTKLLSICNSICDLECAWISSWSGCQSQPFNFICSWQIYTLMKNNDASQT